MHNYIQEVQEVHARFRKLGNNAIELIFAPVFKTSEAMLDSNSASQGIDLVDYYFF